MAQTMRFTSADLEAFPDDGKRYEIIDGELYVAKAPSMEHQITCVAATVVLHRWNSVTKAGLVVAGPGVIFADDDDVIPDVVWISRERLAASLGADRKLHAAPELVIEVLSPGTANEHRDREAKLKLYSRRGVREYWIFSWQRREIEVYRRAQLQLQLVATLTESDVLESPLLDGFSVPVREFFADIPVI